MSESPPVLGVLLAHGSMAQGMADALRRITGLEEGALIPLSNEGKSPEVLSEELKQHVGDAPAVVFTDLPSGSCALTARLLCRESKVQAVVCGVNLPILLDFVFHRHLPLEELVPRLLGKGHASLQSQPFFLPHADPPVPD